MKRTSWFVLLGMIGLLAFMLGPAIMAGPPEPAATPTATETETPSVEDRERAMEQAILREINDARRSRDIHGLEVSELQSKLARSHSSDMVRDGYYDHEAPDGRTFLPSCRPAAENLYLADSSATNPEFTAEKTVQAWLDSDSHREILLSPRWTSVGIGVSLQWGGPQYVTANFC